MSRALLFCVSLSLACYESHGLSGDALDAAPADSGADVIRIDASVRDVSVRDVSVRDVSTPDASVQTCPSGLTLIDQQNVDWDPVDCGAAAYPRALAVGGANGPFQLAITEERFCDDRPGAVWARPVTIEGGRLRFGPSESMGFAQGPAHLASNGTEFAACSGAALFIRRADGVTLSEMLREAPVSVPGCAQGIACLGLAHDGTGWGANWNRFECDVSLQEMSRSGPLGGLREEPFIAAGTTVSITATPSGFASLAHRGDRTTLHSWSRDADMPSTLELGGVPVGLSALTPWPFVAGAWAVVFADRHSVGLRVFDEDGELLLERLYDAGGLMGYGPISINAATGSFGVAAGVGYGWEGGRVDAATRFTAFAGEDADLAAALTVADLGTAMEAPIHVAVSGDYVLVHQMRVTPDPESAGTEALLFSCQ